MSRWQKQCDAQSCEEAAGQQLSGKQMAALEKRLEEIPRCLERLRKSGLKRRSETDPDSRFLRDRRGIHAGLHGGSGGSAKISLISRPARGAKRHRQRDAGPSGGGGRATLPGTPAEGQRRQRLLLTWRPSWNWPKRGLDVYVPDSNLARELNRGQRAPGAPSVRHPEHRRMRRKLRDPAGHRGPISGARRSMEPVIGVLKEQRGMRQFRRRRLEKVAVEFAPAATAFNLTRLWRNKPKLDQEG